MGVRVVQRIGKRRIYSTYVDFQIDRLICEATIRSADATSFETQAVAIAQVLADRIIRYAQGKLSSAAVTLPRPLGMSQPRPGAPDLTAMVLQTKDVKPAYVVGQGYAPDDNAILSYFRQFQLNQRSGLILLRNSVALQRSRREAAGRMLILRSTFSGAEAATTLANLVLPGAKSPTLDRAPRGLGIGDESFAVSANFVAQTRHLRAVLIHVRRDRVVETVIVIGEPQALNESRVGRYGRALNATLKRAFTKKLAA